MNIELAHPLWFVILPLPLVVYWLLPAYKTKQSATKVPFFAQLVEALGESPSMGAQQLRPRWWQRIVLILSWVFIVTALAKPMTLGTPIVKESIGRDLMVILDLSGSMSERDFVSDSGKKVDRLDAAKQVLEEFAKQREGDRLGMILFGDEAFVQAPFTADHQAWLELLRQTEVAMAGPSTNLGDAIGLAIKVFDDQQQAEAPNEPEKEKVVVVLTDGNDTGSFVEPIDAAKVAAVKGVRIHMIAMGDPTTVGEQALDMDTINRVAKETGGQSFEALDRQALGEAYSVISDIEPQLYESTTYRPKQSIHHYFVIAIVLLNLIAFGAVTLTKKLRSRAINMESRKEQNHV
ncbi:VWA domain-containing protein [Vibrio sp. SCSIO 43135]|uniref:vWA domain-containing protein n=1 Tax=Vibrio sp. SCSIO 43135 TaxID=2819096 RepID=UPI00207518AB|nr:VWA domain-containing protein [Vibrio sp. SCSIO 43135]USD42701.1 VWA domain-containing protein [Vibrio sp. SCSIO 43135]